MATCPFNGFGECLSTCALKVNGMCAIVVNGGRVTQLKNAIDDVKRAIDDLTLQQMEQQEVKRPKVVREINDEEVDKYVEAVNPLTIANVTTAQVYHDFGNWCAARGLSPCTQLKLSRRITNFHPLEAKMGTFVPIVKTKA